LASAISVTVPEPSSSAPLLMMSPGRGVGRVWPVQLAIALRRSPKANCS
jgi:hypothetical protein